MSTDSTLENGNNAWMLFCSTLVWLMVPGVGFFYSGMSRTNSALSMITLCLWSMAAVSIQWLVIGYSLAFGESTAKLIGDFSKILFMGSVLWGDVTSETASNLIYALYQGMIAGITPALVVGATSDRGRFLPTMIFVVLWTTFVYDPIVYWVWGKGWGGNYGIQALDFAGGTCVHIAAGAAAVAYTYVLGAREASMRNYKPHNVVQVLLGTSLLWFGWFGFNGGSANGATLRTAIVLINTNLAASAGGIAWAVKTYIYEHRFSALSFCFGAVAGMVAITPGSGFISPAFSVIFGTLGSLSCACFAELKDSIGLDDAMDIVAVHGIGGFVGTVLTGIFASKHIATIDGNHTNYYDEIPRPISGGWIDGNWSQVPFQLAVSTAAALWSFSITCIILFIMNKIPFLKLRLDHEFARSGLDTQLTETAYSLRSP